MFNDLVSVSLLLLGLAIVGIGILFLMDFLRGKKIRLEPEPKEIQRQSPKSRTVMAIFYLLFAVCFLLGNFFEALKKPFWERPVAVVAVVCAFTLFVISMMNLYKVVREKRVQAKS